MSKINPAVVAAVFQSGARSAASQKGILTRTSLEASIAADRLVSAAPGLLRKAGAPALALSTLGLAGCGAFTPKPQNPADALEYQRLADKKVDLSDQAKNNLLDTTARYIALSLKSKDADQKQKATNLLNRTVATLKVLGQNDLAESFKEKATDSDVTDDLEVVTKEYKSLTTRAKREAYAFGVAAKFYYLEKADIPANDKKLAEAIRKFSDENDAEYDRYSRAWTSSENYDTVSIALYSFAAEKTFGHLVPATGVSPKAAPSTVKSADLVDLVVSIIDADSDSATKLTSKARLTRVLGSKKSELEQNIVAIQADLAKAGRADLLDKGSDAYKAALNTLEAAKTKADTKLKALEDANKEIPGTFDEKTVTAAKKEVETAQAAINAFKAEKTVTESNDLTAKKAELAKVVAQLTTFNKDDASKKLFVKEIKTAEAKKTKLSAEIKKLDEAAKNKANADKFRVISGTKAYKAFVALLETQAKASTEEVVKTAQERLKEANKTKDSNVLAAKRKVIRDLSNISGYRSGAGALKDALKPVGKSFREALDNSSIDLLTALSTYKTAEKARKAEAAKEAEAAKKTEVDPGDGISLPTKPAAVDKYKDIRDAVAATGAKNDYYSDKSEISDSKFRAETNTVTINGKQFTVRFLTGLTVKDKKLVTTGGVNMQSKDYRDKPYPILVVDSKGNILASFSIASKHLKNLK